jgi:hypothetical protein
MIDIVCKNVTLRSARWFVFDLIEERERSGYQAKSLSA